LSAVKAAEGLRGRGVKAVPVFWIASEDHDVAEVDDAKVIDRDGGLISVASGAEHREENSVGSAILNDAVSPSIEKMFAALKHTEFTDGLRDLVSKAYSAHAGFAAAFGKLLAALTREYGLIIVDPLHPVLKKLASPIYVEAIRRSGDIANALVARDEELRSAGLEPQVAVDNNYFPLFWHADSGERLALRFDKDGSVRAKDNSKFSIDDLAKLAASSPDRFSPNVMLRPVVQDYLFPTVCYFGGGAEIAYFAQNSEVYKCLDRPVTPILHRQSFTVVEAKHRRTLETYELRLTDLFTGLDRLLPKIVDEHLDRSTARTFAEVEEAINTQLNRLDRELSEIDAGLAASLATRRRKIVYHIAALRDKFRRFEIQKDATIDRRINSLFNSLLPGGGLQERSLNVTYFLNNYGPRFVDWMYNAIDLDDRGHRVVYF
jgi:bacillithiol biosynthesis cysteine-adding enzyme BshC